MARRGGTSSGLGSSAVGRATAGWRTASGAGAAAAAVVSAAPRRVVSSAGIRTARHRRRPPKTCAGARAPHNTLRGASPYRRRAGSATTLGAGGFPCPFPAPRGACRRRLAQSASQRPRQQTAPRPAADAQTPPPAAPAASAGGALSGLSVPPPAAAYALLAAALAVAAVFFSALVAMPAHRRSVPFISLLERPG